MAHWHYYMKTKICTRFVWLNTEKCNKNIAYTNVSYMSHTFKSSVESQKAAITIQRCSVENQKGTIAVDFVQR